MSDHPRGYLQAAGAVHPDKYTCGIHKPCPVVRYQSSQCTAFSHIKWRQKLLDTTCIGNIAGNRYSHTGNERNKGGYRSTHVTGVCIGQHGQVLIAGSSHSQTQTDEQQLPVFYVIFQPTYLWHRSLDY